MAKQIGAGDLYYRVNCQRRGTAEDDEGNTQTGFVTQFSLRAAYRHLRGNEQVIAGRLGGVHPVVVIVRENSLSRQITADWQLVDARDGTVFAVKDVTPNVQDRSMIDLLCQWGVPA